jgi:hypothetical protein
MNRMKALEHGALYGTSSHTGQLYLLQLTKQGYNCAGCCCCCWCSFRLAALHAELQIKVPITSTYDTFLCCRSCCNDH